MLNNNGRIRSLSVFKSYQEIKLTIVFLIFLRHYSPELHAISTLYIRCYLNNCRHADVNDDDDSRDEPAFSI